MPAHTALRLALALGALALAAGCAPTRVDAVRVPLPLGTWYATITNGASDCGSESWREGETSSGVEVSIEAGATEGALVAHVRGLVGGLLYLGYGTAQFDGGLERSRLRLTLRSLNEREADGMCSFRTEIELDARVRPDRLDGVLRYSRVLGAGCTPDDACESYQSFRATTAPPPLVDGSVPDGGLDGAVPLDAATADR